MDFNIFIIQSILFEIECTEGELRLLTDTEENFPKVYNVIEQLKSFLKAENYIDGETIILHKKNAVMEVLRLFMINTEYNTYCTNFEHPYINLIPRLSTYLLAHICCDLPLIDIVFPASYILPMSYKIEIINSILYDVIPAWTEPKSIFNIKFLFLMNAIPIFQTVKKVEECDGYNYIFDNLVITSSFINIAWNSIEDMKVYIASCVHLFLYILSLCDVENENFHEFIINMMSPLQVCMDFTDELWDVRTYFGIPLEEVLGELCYNVMKKYSTFDPAEELVILCEQKCSYLNPIPLEEQLEKADLVKITKNLCVDVNNFKQQFQLLLNHPDLPRNELYINYLYDNYNLCTFEDILNLLSKNDIGTMIRANNNIICLILRFCSQLEDIDLSKIVTFWYSSKLGKSTNLLTHPNNIVSQQLEFVVNEQNIFNFVRNKTLNNIIMCLVLQKPGEVIEYLFAFCMTSDVYTLLINTFLYLKPLYENDGMIIDILRSIFNQFEPYLEYFEICSNFFNIMLNIGFFPKSGIFETIFFEHWTKNLGITNYNHAYLLFKLINTLGLVFIVNKTYDDDSHDILLLIFKLIKQTRRKFISYDVKDHQMVNELVTFVQTKVQLGAYADFTSLFAFEYDSFTGFYFEKLFGDERLCLLDYLVPNFKYDCFSIKRLMKVLPACTSTEWFLICRDIINRLGTRTSLRLLTDVINCLSLIVRTNKIQKSIHNLISCLIHYRLVIEKLVQVNQLSLEEEIYIINIVSTVICVMPNKLKKIQGKPLISLFNTEALKILKNNGDLLKIASLLVDAELRKSILEKLEKGTRRR